MPGRWLTAFGVLLGAAVYFVLVEQHRGTNPQWDNYAQFLPYAIHAVRALGNDGKGLLWNPFNECGVPFFANGVAGLLYPPHLLFLAFEPNVAVHLVLIVDMVLGGLGMLLLARYWGLGWPAAIGGALALEIGDPMAQFVGWNPMITGTFAWAPWALLACERLLRRPSRGGVVCLAVVLAIQLLPGLVVMNALTYHLLAFRIAWEFLGRWPERPWRPVIAVAAGMVLAPLLVAVQMLPYVEFAQESIRIVIPVAERLHTFSLPFDQYVATTAVRSPPVPFLVVPIVLAGIAPFAPAMRRIAWCYLAVSVLFAVLALGYLTPLFALYVKLPPGGSVLNIPSRPFWVTGLCLSVLTALGLQAIASERARWLPCLIVVAATATLYWCAPGGLRRTEVAALGLVVLAAVAARAYPRLGEYAVWLAVAGLALNLSTTSLRWGGNLLADLSVYRKHAPALEEIAQRSMTAQDRFLIMPSFSSEVGVWLMRRTSTVLGLRNFSHYEALPLRRYMEYLVMMRTGTPFRRYTDYIFTIGWFLPGFRPRLLDVAAVRYLVMPSDGDTVAQNADLPRVATADDGLHVYRNDNALARARFVPRLEVVPEPEALLVRLANGDDDLAAAAFVEEAPPSGFTGAEGAPRAGDARFVVDDPERVVVDVDAPQRGFLVLADTFYPGWRATVDDRPVPILRANYMFRLVEVSAGRSRVEFRFFPTRFTLAAVVSGATVALLLVLLAAGPLTTSCYPWLRRRRASRRSPGARAVPS
jgi:hypothetical protein